MSLSTIRKALISKFTNTSSTSQTAKLASYVAACIHSAHEGKTLPRGSICAVLCKEFLTVARESAVAREHRNVKVGKHFHILVREAYQRNAVRPTTFATGFDNPMYQCN